MKKNYFNQIAVLLFVTLFIGCGGNEDDNENTNTVNNDDYLYYFSGEIDGEPFIYGQKTDVTNQTYFVATSNTLPSTCAYSQDNGYRFNSGIYPPLVEPLPTMDIEFLRMYVCSNSLSVTDVFNDLFPTKEYQFATNDDDEDENAGKVGMYYSPSADSDLQYTTYNEDVSDNFFEITKSTENNVYYLNEIETAGQTLEGNFAIKLYNVDDVTDVVEITNGKFKMEFKNY